MVKNTAHIEMGFDDSRVMENDYDIDMKRHVFHEGITPLLEKVFGD